MVKNLARGSALSIASALIGYAGWHGEVYGLVFLPFLFFIWRKCQSRTEVFSALLAYYLVAGRGLLLGGGVFFSTPAEPPSWLIGAAVWVLPSALLSLAWAGCWGQKHRGLRLLVLLAVLSLPPLGIIGWANPITAAGALFPALAWYGLALTLVLFYVLTAAPYLALALPFVVLAVGLNLSNAEPSIQPGWISIDTSFGASRGTGDEFLKLKTLQRLVSVQSASAPSGTIFVLPELVGGDWAVNRTWWTQAHAGLAAKKQTLLIGVSEQEDQTTLQYTNKLVSIGENENVSLVDRVPVPVAMWKPWTDEGVIAPWFQSGVGLVGTTRVAHLICYEQLLIWPVLISMGNSPDIILGASSVWWAKGTSIPAIQHEAMASWGRLFNKPVVSARNI